MKRAVPYREKWMPETTPTYNISKDYDPCREGHSNETVTIHYPHGLDAEVCGRCGRSPFRYYLTRRAPRGRIRS